ncbi:capsular polysaccharide synthesis protein [Parahaliea aestuarii]|uniref:Glycosyl transferase n=1 Tax=Parahaliea aestuarii TaxID=1852021 RepID=A0A5C8ZLS7_9GAMM|nr:capsular polysaccharide synthesis protein [Parahaliea aestuarii]TXS89418.1 hypothetical protein FVW59_18050 [Parahaliea aestuarii]
MSFPIWIYWETPKGRKMPTYISMCLEAIKFWGQGCELKLVTPENLDNYLPDLPNKVHEITSQDENQPSLAIKTAFVRTALLHKYGGLYLDADCLPLFSLSDVCSVLDKKKFSAIRRTTPKGKHISIGLLGSSPDNPIIKQYYKQLFEALSQKTEFEWGEAGARTLTPIVQNNPEHFFDLGEDFAHPILAENQWVFMSKSIELESVCTHNTRIAMLFHRPFTGPSRSIPELGIPAQPNGWLSEWSAEQLYYGDLLISKLFRRSLPEHIFLNSFAR